MAKGKRHYHLLVGTPGYMPDSNRLYMTLGIARGALKDEVNMAREAGFVCFGNLRDGFFECYPKRKGRITMLPERIEIVECHEKRCLEELEE